MTFALFTRRLHDGERGQNPDPLVAVRPEEVVAVVAGVRDGASIYLRSHTEIVIGVAEDVATVLQRLHEGGSVT